MTLGPSFCSYNLDLVILAKKQEMLEQYMNDKYVGLATRLSSLESKFSASQSAPDAFAANTSHSVVQCDDLAIRISSLSSSSSSSFYSPKLHIHKTRKRIQLARHTRLEERLQ